MRMTDLHGDIIREIRLDEIDPDLKLAAIKGLAYSPDGTKIAFIADYLEIYVLDLKHMSVSQMTPDNQEVYATLTWLPR